jgi:hypothetical protein
MFGDVLAEESIQKKEKAEKVFFYLRVEEPLNFKILL